MARKNALVAATIFSKERPDICALISIGILAVCMVLQLFFKPYHDGGHTVVEQTTSGIITYTRAQDLVPIDHFTYVVAGVMAGVLPGALAWFDSPNHPEFSSGGHLILGVTVGLATCFAVLVALELKVGGAAVVCIASVTGGAVALVSGIANGGLVGFFVAFGVINGQVSDDNDDNEYKCCVALESGEQFIFKAPSDHTQEAIRVASGKMNPIALIAGRVQWIVTQTFSVRTESAVDSPLSDRMCSRGEVLTELERAELPDGKLSVRVDGGWTSVDDDENRVLLVPVPQIVLYGHTLSRLSLCKHSTPLDKFELVCLVATCCGYLLGFVCYYSVLPRVPQQNEANTWRSILISISAVVVAMVPFVATRVFLKSTAKVGAATDNTNLESGAESLLSEAEMMAMDKESIRNVSKPRNEHSVVNPCFDQPLW